MLCLVCSDLKNPGRWNFCLKWFVEKSQSFTFLVFFLEKKFPFPVRGQSQVQGQRESSGGNFFSSQLDRKFVRGLWATHESFQRGEGGNRFSQSWLFYSLPGRLWTNKYFLGGQRQKSHSCSVGWMFFTDKEIIFISSRSWMLKVALNKNFSIFSSLATPACLKSVLVWNASARWRTKKWRVCALQATALAHPPPPKLLPLAPLLFRLWACVLFSAKAFQSLTWRSQVISAYPPFPCLSLPESSAWIKIRFRTESFHTIATKNL